MHDKRMHKKTILMVTTIRNQNDQLLTSSFNYKITYYICRSKLKPPSGQKEKSKILL